VPIGLPLITGYSAHGQSTPKQVSVGLVSTPLLLANADRIYVQFNNNSDQQMWVSKEVLAVVGEGTRLNPGAMLNFSGGEVYLGQYNAITMGVPKNMQVEEGIL
jgi:hypothetical protein